MKLKSNQNIFLSIVEHIQRIILFHMCVLVGLMDRCHTVVGFTHYSHSDEMSVIARRACYRNLAIMTRCEQAHAPFPLLLFSCDHFDQIGALTSLTAAPNA